MSDDIWGRLAAPFPPEVEKTRPGRAGMTFTYIDARDVMDRLDAVLTPAGWDFECEAVAHEDVVHGTLRLRVDNQYVVREDHGYPNSESDDEPVKSATSDALRRCAVGFGIARYLYQRKPTNGHASGSASAAGRSGGAPLPRPAASGEPEFPPAEFAGDDEGVCPDHRKAWRSGSRGWYCATKVGDGWCQRHPSKAWAARHEV